MESPDYPRTYVLDHSGHVNAAHEDGPLPSHQPGTNRYRISPHPIGANHAVQYPIGVDQSGPNTGNMQPTLPYQALPRSEVPPEPYDTEVPATDPNPIALNSSVLCEWRISRTDLETVALTFQHIEVSTSVHLTCSDYFSVTVVVQFCRVYLYRPLVVLRESSSLKRYMITYAY